MSAERLPFEPKPRLAELRADIRAEREARTTATVVGVLPARVDLVIYQGDDFFLNVTVDDSVTPIDLTGYIPQAEIRTAPGATTVTATFDATIADSTTVALHLPNDQSMLLTGNAAWDVQITDLAGVVTTLAYGTVTLTKQVTP